MKPKLKIHDTGGTGQAIVLIHGFPLSHQSFTQQFDAFTNAGLRVVAYDRRGFGDSEKPLTGYDYDCLADDLRGVVEDLNLGEFILLGFSMGGGEVARYVSRHGGKGVNGIVFAASVTPCLAKQENNLDGPLTAQAASAKLDSLQRDREAYFETFVRKFYTAKNEVLVDDTELKNALNLCHQSAQHAAVECVRAFSSTDFRDDLKAVTVPTLVIHGDSDVVVPFEGSGYRTFKAIPTAKLELITGGPHGINVSHASQFNESVIQFANSLTSDKT